MKGLYVMDRRMGLRISAGMVRGWKSAREVCVMDIGDRR